MKFPIARTIQAALCRAEFDVHSIKLEALSHDGQRCYLTVYLANEPRPDMAAADLVAALRNIALPFVVRAGRPGQVIAHLVADRTLLADEKLLLIQLAQVPHE